MDKMKKNIKGKNQNTNSIKNWPLDERPREKLFKHGEHSLSNSELLAILLRSGTKGQSALDLARSLMKKFKNFRSMTNVDLRTWKEFKGLGKAKIAQIKASIEIARRYAILEENDEKKTGIKYPEDVVKLFKVRLRDLKIEIVKVLYLNIKNRIIAEEDISQGTPTITYPIIRVIISKALQHFAAGIICLHNHPSGEPNPSKEDENFTADLRQSCKLMEIKLIDHIIFGENKFYSFNRCKIQKY